MENREKKDIHHRNRSYKTAIGKLETDKNIVPRNKVLILQFIRDCRLGKTLKGRQKKSIGTARCLKYIHLLKKISRWLDKPFDRVSQADMERLIEDLENDRYNYNLVGKNGKVIKSKRLAPSTKLDYKKTLRKFYKWLQGNNDHYPELVDWIDTYEEHREIPALRRNEIEQLADSAKLRDKTIIMFLFDSGVRAEEFLNIRVGDLTRIEETYKVRIVFSKTKPRTIHLPICSKYVELWLHESSDRDDQSYLFPITYEGLRMMLHRVSKRVFGKRVTPHILRHSSATYYANLLNHHQLCYRYGWSMASDMPNRYIDREGIFDEETRHVVKANDLAGLEKQNVVLKEEISLVKASSEQLGQQLAEIKQKYDELFEGKGFMELLASLARKQKSMAETLKQITGKRFDVVLPGQGRYLRGAKLSCRPGD